MLRPDFDYGNTAWGVLRRWHERTSLGSGLVITQMHHCKTCGRFYAGAQVVGFGEGQAGVHEGAVFLLVACVVAEEALAGQGQDLFAD